MLEETDEEERECVGEFVCDTGFDLLGDNVGGVRHALTEATFEEVETELDAFEGDVLLDDWSTLMDRVNPLLGEFVALEFRLLLLLLLLLFVGNNAGNSEFLSSFNTNFLGTDAAAAPDPFPAAVVVCVVLVAFPGFLVPFACDCCCCFRLFAEVLADGLAFGVDMIASSD